jgi:hypothetical protein
VSSWGSVPLVTGIPVNGVLRSAECQVQEITGAVPCHSLLLRIPRPFLLRATPDFPGLTPGPLRMFRDAMSGQDTLSGGLLSPSAGSLLGKLFGARPAWSGQECRLNA